MRKRRFQSSPFDEINMIPLIDITFFLLIIFLLLGSSDGFSTEWVDDGKRAPVLANGLFSAIAFIIGAVTSTACGYLGMMIGTYANARTALEARRGLAPACRARFRCWRPGASFPPRP